MTPASTDTHRNSPLAAHGERPTSAVFAGMRMATGGPALVAGGNALVDLSAVPRRLVVGPGAADWVSRHTGLRPGAMFLISTGEGGCCVRLHQQQYLLIGALHASAAPGWLDAQSATDALVLPYECAEFALLGPCREPVLRELSTLRPDAIVPGRWVAARLAHADIGLRTVDDPQTHWRIVCSPADAHYLYGVVSELVREHDGVVTTFDAYLDHLAVPAAAFLRPRDSAAD